MTRVGMVELKECVWCDTKESDWMEGLQKGVTTQVAAS